MVAWITNQPLDLELARMITREQPKIKFLAHPTLGAFLLWFDREGWAAREKLRVLTNIYRAGDGDAHAADNVVRAIEATDERLRSTPLLIYCTSPKAVEHLKKKALITSEPTNVKDFMLTGKIDKKKEKD